MNLLRSDERKSGLINHTFARVLTQAFYMVIEIIDPHAARPGPCAKGGVTVHHSMHGSRVCHHQNRFAEFEKWARFVRKQNDRTFDDAWYHNHSRDVLAVEFFWSADRSLPREVQKFAQRSCKPASETNPKNCAASPCSDGCLMRL